MIVASIDIGTNTVLLLIAKTEGGKQLTTILNEYRIPRIGKGLLAGNPIKSEKISELLRVLSEYEIVIKRYNCERIIVTATNAFRIASNRYEIEKNIIDQFGWKVNTITGEEEAQLSFLGSVVNIARDEEILVIDIGGGSTELTFGTDSKIKFRKSFQIGVVSGTEKFLKNDPPCFQEIKKFENHLDNLFNELKNPGYAPQKTIALAGTPTTLACMNHGFTKYNEELIEGNILDFKEILHIKEILSKLSSFEIIRIYKSIVNGREDLILCGSIILLKIMAKLNLSNVIVSTKGIRYGAIIKEII